MLRQTPPLIIIRGILAASLYLLLQWNAISDSYPVVVFCSLRFKQNKNPTTEQALRGKRRHAPYRKLRTGPPTELWVMSSTSNDENRWQFPLPLLPRPLFRNLIKLSTINGLNRQSLWKAHTIALIHVKKNNIRYIWTFKHK